MAYRIMPVLLVIVLCAGCATSNYYKGMQMKQEMDCDKLHGPERDACLKQSGMSYDEYQRQLKEREQDK